MIAMMTASAITHTAGGSPPRAGSVGRGGADAGTACAVGAAVGAAVLGDGGSA